MADPGNDSLFGQAVETLTAQDKMEEVLALASARANAMADLGKAAEAWALAGRTALDLDQDGQALAFFRQALQADGAEPTACEFLHRYFSDNNRFAEAADVSEGQLATLALRDEQNLTEMDADELAERAESQHSASEEDEERATQHFVLAQLYEDRLGRVDRALYHYQRSWQFDQARTQALESARVLYLSLGDIDMAENLYRAQLQHLAALPEDTTEDRAKLRLEAGRLLAEFGRHVVAAEHVEKATELAPNSIEARQTLVDIYSSTDFEGDVEARRRAGEILIGLVGEKKADDPRRAELVRRAQEITPPDHDSQVGIEAALRRAEEWQELSRFYQDALRATDSSDKKRETLIKLSELYENQIEDRTQRKRYLSQLAALHEPPNKYSNEIRELYRADQDWEELVALMEREVGFLKESTKSYVDELLEIISILGEKLDNKERAAEQVHKVLSVDPVNPRALSEYSAHFRNRKDWRGLANLLEYSAEQFSIREDKEKAKDALKELADVYEMQLGEKDRARGTHRRVIKITPDDLHSNDSLARLGNPRNWEQLVGVLRKEAENAHDAKSRASVMHRMGSVYREHEAPLHVLVAVYEDIVKLTPGDMEAVDSLIKLYEQRGDDSRLSMALRHKLGLQIRAQGSQNSPAEWPQEIKKQREETLLALANLSQERLSDVEGVLLACNGLLELEPSDVKVLKRMATVLEQAGDVVRLEQTLEYHVAVSSGPAEKIELLRRLGRLAENRDDLALDRWERLLALMPEDEEALSALLPLYQAAGRWGEAEHLLSKMIELAEDKDSLDSLLRTRADLVHTHLPESPSGEDALRRLLEIAPNDKNALAALAERQGAEEDWAELSQTLARQIDQNQGDRDFATKLALKRFTILQDHLGDKSEAKQTLEQIVTNLDPTNLDAHRELKALQLEENDFESAVRTAERELFLTSNRDDKLALSLQIGQICQNSLEDKGRALHGFERVLKLDPNHSEALQASSRLYKAQENWPRYASSLENQLQQADEENERRALLLELGEVAAWRLKDFESAHTWLDEAIRVNLDEVALDGTRRVAKESGRWENLIETLNFVRSTQLAKGDSKGYVQTCEEIATIYETELSSPLDAIKSYQAAIAEAPNQADLLKKCEQLAESENSTAAWESLLSSLQVVSAKARPDDVAALAIRQSEIQVSQLDNPDGALADLLAGFARSPDSPEIHTALYGLAKSAGYWDSVIAMEAALALRYEDTNERVEALNRKATVLENETNNPVRAFRTFLVSFLLLPRRKDTLEGLWRVAEKIGPYKDEDQIPQPEPPPAEILEEQPRLGTRSVRFKRAATEEILMDDFIDPSEVGSFRNSGTAPIHLDEIEFGHQGEPTMEIRVSDLVTALGPKSTLPPPIPGLSELPSEESTVLPPPLPPTKTKSRGAKKTAPPPSLPTHSHDSPWAELVAAYNMVLSADPSGSVEWLFKAAEVWEDGADDPERAFDVLSRSLEREPENQEARQRLHALAEKHNLSTSLEELLERTADQAASASSATSILMEVARLYRTQEKEEKLERTLRRVLGIDPQNKNARDELAQICRDRKDWNALAQLLEERIGRKDLSNLPFADALEKSEELATIYNEKLERPKESAEVLERLVDTHPRNLEPIQLLASQYLKMGSWTQAIGALNRVSSLSDGKKASSEAVKQIAALYTDKLNLPDKALETYERLQQLDPKDKEIFERLTRLYRRYEKWNELAEVLGARAESTTDLDELRSIRLERGVLMLERLDDPEAAVADLTEANADGRDSRTAVPLAKALVANGSANEATLVLAELLEDESNPDDQRAEWLTQLAFVRFDHLNDNDGAIRSIEKALTLAPSSPAALAASALFAGKSKDPRSFANAKLREAEAQTSTTDKVKGMLVAAETLRQRCGAPEEARSLYEKILELVPHNEEATWGLVEIAESNEDIAEATQILNQHLSEASLDAIEHAQAVTRLGSYAEKMEEYDVAESHYRDAVTRAPEYNPCIWALADLLEEQEANDRLSTFLEECMETVSSEKNATQAELRRRLAETYTKSNRLDDAYQVLSDADRIQRGNLQIKLALGENRFEAKRWKEAALHLSALVDNAQTEKYPRQVATGLYMAGVAETRALQPEAAEPLYKKAVSLWPECAPALRALAELAMSRGNFEVASDLLARHAQATDDSRERLRLLEGLGDKAIESLNDAKRASSYYESAVGSADPLTAEHIPLLEKLLAAQESVQNREGMGVTCQHLGRVSKTPTEKSARYKQAAEHFLADGDELRAKSAAEAALATNPYDLTAAAIASDLNLAAGEYEQVAATLGRALSYKGEVDKEDTIRQAYLWSRLGDARRQRGDAKGAVAALESAIGVAPDSDGALTARRHLVEMWAELPERTMSVVEHCRILALATADARDILDYAKQLSRDGKDDSARIVYELAYAMGENLSQEESDFVEAQRPASLADDAAYAFSIPSKVRKKVFAELEESPVAALLNILWPAAPFLWSNAKTALERNEATGARIGKTTQFRATTIYPQIAKLLDAPASVLYRARGDSPPPIQVVCCSPPSIVIQSTLLEMEEISEAGIRFLLARCAELTHPARVVATGLPESDFLELISSIERLFTDESNVTEEDKRLFKLLPVKVRTRLKDFFHTLELPLEPSQFRELCLKAAECMGLLVAGNVAAAVKHSFISSSNAVPKHIEQFILSPHFASLRERFNN